MTIEVCRYSMPRVVLEKSGPCIPVLIGGLPFLALLATGATISLLDIPIARELGMPEAGTGSISGIAGKAEFPRFDGIVEIPWLETSVQAPVQGAPLRANDLPWHAIIGRDILLQFDLRINVPAGIISFLRDVPATD